MNTAVRRTLAAAACTVVASAAAAAAAAPAYAHHPHHLQTPGTCVDRNGMGFGTDPATGEPQEHSDNTADPGDTSFHERVHKGRAGDAAPARSNKQVAVLGGLCPAG